MLLAASAEPRPSTRQPAPLPPLLVAAAEAAALAASLAAVVVRGPLPRRVPPSLLPSLALLSSCAMSNAPLRFLHLLLLL